MTASSFNATTGAPEYDSADAPDTAVNPTEVAAFAAARGNVPKGTTAERTAFAFKEDGAYWSDTDDDSLYRWNGSAWDLVWRDSGWVTVSSFSNSFTSATAPDTVKYRRIGDVVHVSGVLSRGTAPGSTPLTAFTLPAGFRPGSTLRIPGRPDTAQLTAVLTTGAVQMAWPPGTGALGTLAGISFVAEN